MSEPLNLVLKELLQASRRYSGSMRKLSRHTKVPESTITHWLVDGSVPEITAFRKLMARSYPKDFKARIADAVLQEHFDRYHQHLDDGKRLGASYARIEKLLQVKGIPEEVTEAWTKVSKTEALPEHFLRYKKPFQYLLFNYLDTENPDIVGFVQQLKTEWNLPNHLMAKVLNVEKHVIDLMLAPINKDKTPIPSYKRFILPVSKSPYLEINPIGLDKFFYLCRGDKTYKDYDQLFSDFSDKIARAHKTILNGSQKDEELSRIGKECWQAMVKHSGYTYEYFLEKLNLYSSENNLPIIPQSTARKYFFSNAFFGGTEARHPERADMLVKTIVKNPKAQKNLAAVLLGVPQHVTPKEAENMYKNSEITIGGLFQYSRTAFRDSRKEMATKLDKKSTITIDKIERNEGKMILKKDLKRFWNEYLGKPLNEKSVDCVFEKSKQDILLGRSHVHTYQLSNNGSVKQHSSR